jgi:trehalose/maltose transport system permease protein
MAISIPVSTQQTPFKKGRKPLEIFGRVLFYAIILVLLVYTIFPFYWAVKTSLTPPGQIFADPIEYWPSRPTFQNYIAVFEQRAFHLNLLSSFVVSTSTVFLSMVIGSLAAYALGRFRFKGKQFMMYAVLAVSMFPQIAVLPGLFSLVRTEILGVKLYNTWGSLIFSYLIFTLPFTVWVLTSFVREIPAELEEAALVDGASTSQTLWHVLLPVMGPSLVTTGLLAFINAWNEYLFALTFILTPDLKTVPVSITSFGGASSYESPWTIIMAASVIVTVPLIILVLIFQNRIVSGLTAGAVKG